MEDMDREKFEASLLELPLYQYEFLTPQELTFTERIRVVCEQECPMYGRSWACPPAVGTVAECKARCLSYDQVLLLTSIAEVADTADLEETLATRAPHEALTRDVKQLLLDCGAQDVMALSTEACAHCETCSYPDAPCRHPDRMFPCVESHGVTVTDLAERYGMEFFNAGMVIWFSLLFYR